MLVLLNIPLRRDAPALPEGEPFIVNACNLKPLTPGEVAAERQTERGFRRKQGWTPKADGEGTNIKLTFR